MDRSNPDFVEELRQAKTTEEFEEFLKRHDSEMKIESFGDVVLRLCDERGIAPSVVQTRIAVSKSQFYYVINGTRNPSKESVLKIAFGLKATPKEMNELLGAAGYQELNPKNKEDAILIFGMENGKEIEKIDELLREYNSKLRLKDKE